MATVAGALLGSLTGPAAPVFVPLLTAVGSYIDNTYLIPALFKPETPSLGELGSVEANWADDGGPAARCYGGRARIAGQYLWVSSPQAVTEPGNAKRGEPTTKYWKVDALVGLCRNEIQRVRTLLFDGELAYTDEILPKILATQGVAVGAPIYGPPKAVQEWVYNVNNYAPWGTEVGWELRRWHNRFEEFSPGSSPDLAKMRPGDDIKIKNQRTKPNQFVELRCIGSGVDTSSRAYFEVDVPSTAYVGVYGSEYNGTLILVTGRGANRRELFMRVSGFVPTQGIHRKPLPSPGSVIRWWIPNTPGAVPAGTWSTTERTVSQVNTATGLVTFTQDVPDPYWAAGSVQVMSKGAPPQIPDWQLPWGVAQNGDVWEFEQNAKRWRSDQLNETRSRFYLGKPEGQNPQVIKDSFGFSPGLPGRSMVELRDLKLDQFGNRVPHVTAILDEVDRFPTGYRVVSAAGATAVLEGGAGDFQSGDQIQFEDDPNQFTYTVALWVPSTGVLTVSPSFTWVPPAGKEVLYQQATRQERTLAETVSYLCSKVAGIPSYLIDVSALNDGTKMLGIAWTGLREMKEVLTQLINAYRISMVEHEGKLVWFYTDQPRVYDLDPDLLGARVRGSTAKDRIENYKQTDPSTLPRRVSLRYRDADEAADLAYATQDAVAAGTLLDPLADSENRAIEVDVPLLDATAVTLVNQIRDEILAMGGTAVVTLPWYAAHVRAGDEWQTTDAVQGRKWTIRAQRVEHDAASWTVQVTLLVRRDVR